MDVTNHKNSTPYSFLKRAFLSSKKHRSGNSCASCLRKEFDNESNLH